jgi:tubulin polyglutamylase TTLL6/13
MDFPISTHLPSRRKKQQQKKARDNYIIVNIRDTQYPIIGQSTVKLGSEWRNTANPKYLWNVYWTDSGLNIENVVRKAKDFQRINHFPGMVHIYRKNCLTRTITRMQRLNHSEYNFYPETWILPHDYQEVVQYLEIGGNPCVIIKPSGGAQV